MTDLRRGDEPAGDPAVDAAWRRASDEAPPTRVDDAILAAARAAVRAEPPVRLVPQRASWWIRWQPLAAAAGVVGLAFVLVQLMPREETTRSPEGEVPAPQAMPPAPPAPSARHDAEPVPAAVEPSMASRESSANDAAGTAAESRAALSGVAPPQAARSVASPVSPEAWAHRVAELHAQGDVAAAATELRAFRRAFPDADDYLPPSLLPWAESVAGADSP